LQIRSSANCSPKLSGFCRRRIASRFSPEPFYLHAHQAIAAAIIGRRAKGEPPDPILLRGDLVDAGDHAAADLVFPLAGSLRTAGNVSYYWQRLLELFEARRRPSRGNRHALHRRRPREGRSGSGRWAEADRHGLATAGPRPRRRLRDSVTQHPRRPTQERKEHLGADRCRAPRRGRRLRTTSTSKTAAAGSRGATVPAAFASKPVRLAASQTWAVCERVSAVSTPAACGALRVRGTRARGQEDSSARSKIEAWRRDYNEVRPHSSLDNRTPMEFSRSATGLALSAIQ
jgi:hypothetical protein